MSDTNLVVYHLKRDGNNMKLVVSFNSENMPQEWKCVFSRNASSQLQCEGDWRGVFATFSKAFITIGSLFVARSLNLNALNLVCDDEIPKDFESQIKSSWYDSKDFEYKLSFSQKELPLFGGNE